jgi:hypothetical protein
VRFLALAPAAAFAAACFIPVRPASATLLVYEPFDYIVAAELSDAAPAGGIGLSTYTAPTGPLAQLAVAASGLGYGNLTGAWPPAGNHLGKTNGVTGGRATAGLVQPIVVAPGTAIYWSALMTLDDSSNGNRYAHVTFADTASGDSIGFGESVVGSRAIRVDADTAATGSLAAVGPDNAFVDGHTVLLVGRYLNSASAQGDRLDLLVYDTADAEAIAGGFDLADPAAELAFSLLGRDVDLARIDAVTFAIRGDDNNFIDELRIGTTYADVVPEPGTASLLFAGLVGLAVAGRRRAARRG